MASLVRLSLSIGSLWLLAQWLYNLSLAHTDLATNTVLSSTSSIFTLCFSVLLNRDNLRWLSILAALISFVGCMIVVAQSPSGDARLAVGTSSLGYALAIFSAAMSSLASVLFQKHCPAGLDPSMFMATNGVLAGLFSPLLLYALHRLSLESFHVPTAETLIFLCANAIMGSTLAMYLYTRALLLLSPLVANICLTLSIPTAALTDGIMKRHSFSIGWMFGASIMALGALFAAMDLERVEREILETAEVAELESLLENTSLVPDDDFGKGKSSGGFAAGASVPMKPLRGSSSSASRDRSIAGISRCARDARDWGDDI